MATLYDPLLSLLLKTKYKQVERMLKDPVGCQQQVLQYLIKEGAKTQYGKDHSFNEIKNYNDFKQRVPISNYKQLSPYINRIIAGERNVLWKGVPKFLGKTSGTTSEPKYIPVTSASLKNQINGPQYSALHYFTRYNTTNHLIGKMLLFSDGHFFEDYSGIKAAPISTIANSRIPAMYSSLCLPSLKTNTIADYEERIDAMVRETLGKDIRIIVAMPVWLLVYLRRLVALTKQSFRDHFPNFQLLLLSGMDYAPYLPEIHEYIPPPFDILENYPSTEGFIAYQDKVEERGMQLVLNKGIFFEFIPADELDKDNPCRVCLKDVRLGINYALVLNTDAGLWGYINGDTVRFETVFPHRIKITGRLSQYISAYGEPVTLEETDKALGEMMHETGTTLIDYTVAPNYGENNNLPYHQWFIEFGKLPNDVCEFEAGLNKKICESNFCYKDLVVNKAIQPLKINIGA